jgi:hypothetical protein
MDVTTTPERLRYFQYLDIKTKYSNWFAHWSHTANCIKGLTPKEEIITTLGFVFCALDACTFLT